MYVTDQINSSESEGAFNEFVEEQLENLVDAILTEGDLENFGERGSDILVEMDDIVAPTFVYGDEGEGGGGSGCLLYTSPSPRDMRRSRMPSSA